MTISNEQITFQPNLYIDGMVDTPLTNTSLSVTAGACRDSQDVMDIITTVATTIDFTKNGLNGLDTGSQTASTWYYIYAIGSSLNQAASGFIGSLSGTAPTMPSSYDCYRLIGQAYSNSGTHFAAYATIGTGKTRTKWWTTGITALSGGTADSATAVDLTSGGGLPGNIAYTAIMNVSFTPATAADSVRIVPSGSGITTAGLNVSSVVAAKAQVVQGIINTNIVSGVAKVDYINSAASGATTIVVTGYQYFI